MRSPKQDHRRLRDVVIPKSRYLAEEEAKRKAAESAEDEEDDVFYDTEDDQEDDQDDSSDTVSRCTPCPVVKPTFLCGTDNRTYSSLCRLDYHNCIHQTAIRVSCKGFCPCKGTKIQSEIKPKTTIQSEIEPKTTIQSEIEPETTIQYGIEPETAIQSEIELKTTIQSEIELKTTIQSEIEPKTTIQSKRSDQRLNQRLESEMHLRKKQRLTNLMNKYKLTADKEKKPQQQQQQKQRSPQDKYTFTPEDFKYENKHYKYIKYTKYNKGLPASVAALSKTSLSQYTRLPMTAHFPGTCKGEVRWMFQHLDLDADELLSLQELYDLEHDQSEKCIKPFLDACDTDRDIFVSPREWCHCFEKTDRPCAAVKRRISPEQLGVYIPDCDDEGYYRSTQCHTSVGICWCVDKHGVEVANSRTRGKPSCDLTGQDCLGEEHFDGQEQEETDTESISEETPSIPVPVESTPRHSTCPPKPKKGTDFVTYLVEGEKLLAIPEMDSEPPCIQY
uniref:Uncharacterized protein n=1 Tax=Timema bartmani TaxID=61472 RepID=A0A7R9EX64_9NEOP|nr:unnamed protein product [Timema bartmani]